MRRLLLSLLAVACSPAYAQLGGEYVVSGTNPNGTPYGGTLTVTPRGSINLLAWDTGSNATGSTLQDGDVVAAVFGDDGCGVALYRIDGNGLDGIWANKGSDQMGTEQAQRSSAGRGLTGQYSIVGQNHVGSEYSGDLTIEAAGSAFAMTWTTGSVGVGIQVGDHLAAIYGGSDCGLAAYTVGPDGTLDGTWTMNGGGALGTERAVRK